jgi:hypothetical protein
LLKLIRSCFNQRFESETSVMNNFETNQETPSPPCATNVVYPKDDNKKSIPALGRFYNPLKAAVSLPIRNTIDNQKINEEKKLSIIKKKFQFYKKKK